ncbi:chromosome segregation protein SMC [Pseudomonas aeruginosa]|nr:chromosome segregation protein SMC [Pseudomonas aeruginosa]EKV8099348.1 chromosome segregation protein SMC [Pseudomonas aeruginosa]EKW6729136.1 chromosome segregation protein SMC [Pseudomonas aeruginosa]HED1676357.1 chromosome segregation protein SMC [Pseudomonas aeruginosa]
MEDPDFAESPNGQSLKIPLQEARSKVDNVEYKISVIDQEIAWFDRKANSSALMADYKETMSNWATDKADLEGKRRVLNTRLAQTKSQSEKLIADARQAEEEAARAYAQAVAWSDDEGEKKAADDAQKAAKALSSAMEHQRRQGLLITAMEQEIETIDAHIKEAADEVLKAERSAVVIALERLEEQWDASVKELLDLGAKLYAAKRYMGREQMEFHRFYVGSQLESFKIWDERDLAGMSCRYSPAEIIDINIPSLEPLVESF